MRLHTSASCVLPVLLTQRPSLHRTEQINPSNMRSFAIAALVGTVAAAPAGVVGCSH